MMPPLDPAADCVQIAHELERIGARVADHPELATQCQALAQGWLDQLSEQEIPRAAGLLAGSMLMASLIGAIAESYRDPTIRALMLRALPQAYGLYQVHTLVQVELPRREDLGMPPQTH